jgi:hypothetical protein
MYELSQRHPVWVAEINVTACNSASANNSLYHPEAAMVESLHCRLKVALRDLALQRQNTKFSKQIFQEKEYWGLVPNFHIQGSVRDLYISRIGLPILLEEICRPILGLYKSLTDI